MKEALQRLATSHDLHGATAKMIEMLEKIAPDQAKLGHARAGKAIPADLDIDALLEESWSAYAAEMVSSTVRLDESADGVHNE